MPLTLRTFLLAGTLATAATACHSDYTPGPCNCRGAGKAVRTLTNVAARVGSDSQTRNYALFVPSTSAGSPFEIGILCDSLPSYSLSQIGKRVVFSGTYYAKPGGTSPDTVRYYLSYSQVAAQ